MLVNAIRNCGTRLIAGAFAAAAVAVPLYTALASTDAAPQVTAGPACLAWFGNQEDGNCMGYSNGDGVMIGTPNVGFGPYGLGVYTGPLLPGGSFSRDFG